MNIWVTGAKGFIGSHVVKRLEATGHDVNKSYKADVLIHMEAWANPTGCEEFPTQAVRRNVERTVEIVEQARGRGVKRIIFPSTAAIHDVDDGIVEDDPISMYAWTKKTCENYLEMRSSDDLIVRVLRLGTVYGPGQIGTKARGFVAKAFHALVQGKRFDVWDGEKERDWTFVADVSKAITDSVTPGGLPDENIADWFDIYSIGTGVATRVDEVAKMIVDAWNQVTGRELPYEDAIRSVPQGRDTVPHPDNIIDRPLIDRPLIDCSTSLEIGLLETAKWWAAQDPRVVSRETTS